MLDPRTAAISVHVFDAACGRQRSHRLAAMFACEGVNASMQRHHEHSNIRAVRRPEPALNRRPSAALRRKAERVDRLLEARYGRVRRRRRRDLIDVLVRTILSQNTTDVNSDRGMARLRSRFRSWTAIRDAPVEAVADAIRPAGLGRLKAPRIQAALTTITREGGGRLSLDFLRRWPAQRAKAWLRSLHGVGPKTAAIVLVFGLGKPAFPVDTHVSRVARRIGLIPENMSVEQAHGWMEALVRPARYGAFHLLLVRHGRAVCRAGRPRCEICPLTRLCRFYAAVRRPQRAVGAGVRRGARGGLWRGAG
jgi:endonuclease-3